MELDFVGKAIMTPPSGNKMNKMQEILKVSDSQALNENFDKNMEIEELVPVKAKPKTPSRMIDSPSVDDRIKIAEAENRKLREALKQLNTVIENMKTSAASSYEIVEGAKKYIQEKTMSAQKTTPQKRHLMTPPLNVKIVGFEKQGDHVEYQLEVRFLGGDCSGHVTTKRFTEFLALRQRLLIAADAAARPESSCILFGNAADEMDIRTLSAIRAAKFPSKTYFTCFDDTFLSERSKQLQFFLDAVMEAGKRAGRGASIRSIMSEWFGIPRETEDSVWCDDRIKPLVEYETRARAARNSEVFDNILKQSPLRKMSSDGIDVVVKVHEPSSLRKMKCVPLIIGEDENDEDIL